MDRDEALSILRAHEAELRARGVESLSLFGSVARGDATVDSDVDVVVRLTQEAREGGFAYFGRLEDLTERFAQDPWLPRRFDYRAGLKGASAPSDRTRIHLRFPTLSVGQLNSSRKRGFSNENFCPF